MKRHQRPVITRWPGAIWLGYSLAVCIATTGVTAGANTPAPGDERHHHSLSEKELGSVHFANSCSAKVQSNFQRAIALLHSFQYEQSQDEFAGIARQDSQCAMAYWGMAMSHYHGLWHSGELKAGREALDKARQAASTSSSTTARERAYIDALTAIYQEDGKTEFEHAVAFERKMAEVQASYREDTEAAIFHALSLDISAPATDKNFTNQRQCAEILEPIFAKQPTHPGIAHYLIHCYDNPALADKGIEAARRYAGIAPASAHANHMPSHIFTRVGFWNESIQSNFRSAELARQKESSSANGEARDQRLHALDYLAYAYLQSGQVNAARKVRDQAQSLEPDSATTAIGDYALAAVPARYELELGNWRAASDLKARTKAVPWAQAITLTASGIGAARSNQLDLAAEAERSLAHLRDLAQPNTAYWSNQIEVQRREVAAWIAQASGKNDDALASMRSAVELEESMDKDAVTPGPVVPAREWLGQILQAQQKPGQALTEFEAVLKTAPNRFNALWGAATSAESTGDTDAATKYFRILIEVARSSERPEVDRAHKKLTQMARK